jgi:hypothetical protein
MIEIGRKVVSGVRAAGTVMKDFVSNVGGQPVDVIGIPRLVV